MFQGPVLLLLVVAVVGGIKRNEGKAADKQGLKKEDAEPGK
jgi:hypothetical protein